MTESSITLESLHQEIQALRLTVAKLSVALLKRSALSINDVRDSLGLQSIGSDVFKMVTTQEEIKHFQTEAS